MRYGFVVHCVANVRHLTPQGTPGLLIPLMVVIESISRVIRPLTLAVRLAANIIAGHLLLALIRGGIARIGLSAGATVVVRQILLVVLEAAVAVIQSYVFVVLRVLYVREVA